MLHPYDLGFGRLFERVRDAVVVVDTDDGRIVLWNPAATAIFGYPEAEACALNVDVLVPEALRPRHRTGLAHYRATGHGRYIDAEAVLELPAVRRDGTTLHIELTLSPLPDVAGGRRYVLALIRDVTARTQLAAERAALLATAHEYAARLTELARLKADFTAMVAHEFGSPLAAIGSLADLLARGDLRSEEQAHVVATLRRETALLTSLVADVQVSAAAEQHDFAVAPRPVPVAVLLAEAAAVARTLLHDHPLTVAPAPPVLVRADPERIGQVLRNLLSNAAKYAPPGTPIELRAQPVGERVQIAVADRGPGIHPDDLPRIFEKFGRGRDVEGRRVPGMGLGLYLSRRLLQAHGTDLTVESALGQGTAFGFSMEVVA